MKILIAISLILAPLSFASPAMADPNPPGPPQEDCSFLPASEYLQCMREQHRRWCSEHYPRPSPEWTACIREDI